MKASQYLLTFLGQGVPALEVDKEGRLRGGFSAFAGKEMNGGESGGNGNCNCNCWKQSYQSSESEYSEIFKMYQYDH